MMCKRPKEIRMVGLASLIAQGFVQAVESSAVLQDVTSVWLIIDLQRML
jgi:hypothetical protein